jgi:hypothetical protein
MGLDHDLTQAEVADLVTDRLNRKKPLVPASVSNWLRGAVPDVATIAAIADITAVRAGWLAFGEEPMTPHDARKAHGSGMIEYNPIELTPATDVIPPRTADRKPAPTKKKSATTKRRA